MSYLEKIYDESVRPKTQYPYELAEYLINRFQIPKGARVLDNGCGRGDFLEGFLECGMLAYGTDIEDVKEIQKKDVHFYGGVELENGKLPFEDGFFDLIFTKSVLEHIHKPLNFMEEMKRVLKPGGRLIVMVPDWHSNIYNYYDDFTHVQPYTQIGLDNLLNVSGYKDICVEKFYQLPVVWKYPVLRIVCRCLRILGPVKKVYKNKFYRFSRELILLGTGIKEDKSDEE